MIITGQDIKQSKMFFGLSFKDSFLDNLQQDQGNQ